jgi:hypothetical protein
MAADPDSKSQREEGRRIIAIPDGFLVVNYLEYRRRKTNDDRREETRARVAKHRAAKQLARQTALELQEAHVTNVTRLAAKAEDTSADSGDLSPVSGVTLPPPRRPNLNRDRQLARPDTPVTQHVTAVTHVTPSEAEAEAEAKAVNGRMGFREGDTSHDVPDDLMALPLFAADAVLCRRWPRLSMALRASYPGVDLRNILADAHAYLPRAPRQYKDLGRFLGNQVKMAADSLARRGLAQQARPARRE